MNCSNCTFTLASSSGTNYYFPYPEWASPNNEISKQVDLFNMWEDDSIETVDKGINTQTLHLGGIIGICGAYSGLCFPICCTACFSAPFNNMLEYLETDMNAGEEFTISELGDCLNGVYVIKNFHLETIKHAPWYYRYELELERVRDVI